MFEVGDLSLCCLDTEDGDRCDSTTGSSTSTATLSRGSDAGSSGVEAVEGESGGSDQETAVSPRWAVNTKRPTGGEDGASNLSPSNAPQKRARLTMPASSLPTSSFMPSPLITGFPGMPMVQYIPTIVSPTGQMLPMMMPGAQWPTMHRWLAEQQHKARVMQATALAAAMARRAAHADGSTVRLPATAQSCEAPAQIVPPTPAQPSTDTNDAVIALLGMSTSSDCAAITTTTSATVA